MRKFCNANSGACFTEFIASSTIHLKNYFTNTKKSLTRIDYESI